MNVEPSELLITMITLAGLPLLVMDYQKHKEMVFVVGGYMMMMLGTFSSLLKTDMFILLESLCIMVAGILFAASAFFANKRMKKVVG